MLVGRDFDLERVRSALVGGGERLVTLTGRGGVGKTSLALRAATDLLDEYAATFLTEEKPAAAAAFSETIRDVADPLLGSAPVLELLERGCEVFPQSALAAFVDELLDDVHLLAPLLFFGGENFR